MSWTEKPQTTCICDSLRRNHLREFIHDAHAHGTLPESFATVQLQTCISADASHNVLVVDRHVYGPWRVHATVPRDRHAPAYLIVRLICRTLSYKNASDIRRDASQETNCGRSLSRSL